MTNSLDFMVGPISESKTATWPQHYLLNKPHNNNLPWKIYCKGEYVQTQMNHNKDRETDVPSHCV